MSLNGELELAEEFAAISRKLLAGANPSATLGLIVGLAVQTIDGCEHAGITVIEGRDVSSIASSDEITTLVDRLQAETDEGPCLDAIRREAVFQTGHLSEERRWPSFSRRASLESGVESILSFRLFVEDTTMGALNLYSVHADAFTDHDVAVGAVFATHAAVALSAAKHIGNLEAAVGTRPQVIGEATGILMARQHVSQGEAFAMLRRASQRLNVKLRVVAENMVDKNSPEGQTSPT